MERSPTLISLAAGLLVLSGVFWLLERWQPSIAGQRRARADTRVDIAYYMPEGRRPQGFGILNDDVPAGLVAQLAYPFRRRG